MDTHNHRISVFQFFLGGIISITVITWGDEYVGGALRKLILFLFRSFYNRLIFKLKKTGGIKTGSQLVTLTVTFSSAQS